MAVSYLSTPYQSSQPVMPLDLNLMASVLQQKQALYDANFSKLQSQVSGIASLDVLRDSDRQYRDSKLNATVDRINNLGGVDLSDLNNVAQLEGVISEVLTDDRLLSAVADTKKIRAWQASEDKFKSDPKLLKYYSDANSYINNKKIMEYASGNGRYNGDSTYTPYYDYNEEFRKTLDKLVADKKFTRDGKYYMNSVERIPAEKVEQMARDLMSNKAREQMKRDGIYLYETQFANSKDPEVNRALVINKGLEYATQELANAKSYVNALEAELALDKSDSPAKKQKAELLKQYKQQVDAGEKSLPGLAQKYAASYDNNKDELLYELYSRDYFRGLGKKYSYERETPGINPVAKFLTEMDMAQQRINMDAKALQQNKELALLKMANDKEIAMVKEGLGYFDEKTGQFIKNTPSDGGFKPVLPNLDTRDRDEIVSAMEQRKTQINSQKSTALVKFAQEQLIGLGINVDNSIFDVNKDNTIDAKDFVYWDKITNNVINPIVSGKDEATKNKVVELFRTLSSAYEKSVLGEETFIQKFPKGTDELMKNLFLLDLEEKALDKDIYETKNGQDITTWTMGESGFIERTRIPSNIETTMKTRDQYKAKMFTDADKKTKSYQEVKNGLFTKVSGLPKDFDIIGITPARNGGEGWEFILRDTDKDSKTSSPIYVQVDDTYAAAFGFKKSPSDILDGIIRYDKPVENIPFATNNFRLKYDIVKVNDDLNDRKFKIRIKDKGTSFLINNPNGGYFNSASEAYQFMNAQEVTLSSRNTKREDYINTLKGLQ